MKKHLLSNILGISISLQIALAPAFVFAASAAPAGKAAITPAEAEETAPKALSYVTPTEPGNPSAGNDLVIADSKLVPGYDGASLHLGTAQEKELNRPSFLMKKGLDAKLVHFTSQYIYFQFVLALSAMVEMSLNYQNDPIALQNYMKTYSSFDRAGESVASFGAFLYGDMKMQHFLKQHLKMNGPRQAMLVQQFGMATGLVASTILGEIWNDKTIRLCASSRGTDLIHCDLAFDNWVKTDRIVQYIPMMLQNGGSALIAAGVTKVFQTTIQGGRAVKGLVTGKSQIEQTIAKIEKNSAKVEARKGKILRIKDFRVGGKFLSRVAEHGYTFSDGLAGGVIGLSVFMVVDAVVSSPLMKTYTKNYLEEQNSWLRRAQATIGKSSILPLTWTSYYAYATLSTLFPDRFPKITDDKEKENWMREFDLDTFFKFVRLWAKYNVAARNESGVVSILNMFWPQSISTITRDSKVVDYPQDDFAIMRQAHVAVVSSLDYAKKNLWQTYNVNQCSKDLSLAPQLTFQQALQYYIGLTKAEKQCLVDINLYDNVVSYIDRSQKHRNFIMGPIIAASSAWMEAVSKYQDMQEISYFAYRTLIRNLSAIIHKKPTYKNDEGKQVPVLPITDDTKSYDVVNTFIKEHEQGLKHEQNCSQSDPNYYACIAETQAKDENFLPTTFYGSNEGVGKVSIHNNADYIIEQMACGPDVKDTTAFYDEVSAQTYETYIGKWGRLISEGLEKVYTKIPILEYETFKVFDDKIKDPNSAMVYTPAGYYPRFVPPRITTGSGEICMNPKIGNSTVKEGVWSDGTAEYKGLLPFIVTHMRPDIMNNPKNPNISNFQTWFDENMQPAIDSGFEVFQGVYNRILEQEFSPALLGSKITDGCTGTPNCMSIWRLHKVSLKVYQAMEIEIRVLLGLLNEVYQYPDWLAKQGLNPNEEMAKARAGDDTSKISTSSILRDILKDRANPEQLDTRLMIFLSEAMDSSLPKSAEEQANVPEPLLKSNQKLAADANQLMTLEIGFLRSFHAKDTDMSADKNGLASFNVEQSERYLEAMEKFFTDTRASEINDLQAKIAGLVFRALEGLLQERNTYGKLLVVSELKEQQIDKPEPMRRKGQETVIQAFTAKKPDQQKEETTPQEGQPVAAPVTDKK